MLVTIPLADLVDPATGPAAATTGFGATISAARARWLACDGIVTRVVMGPDGQPLDYGRNERILPPSLRRATELRERHHTTVHHGFRVERQPDDRWRTYRPDGSEILIAEPVLTAS